jgi:hypothetical protein
MSGRVRVLDLVAAIISIKINILPHVGIKIGVGIASHSTKESTKKKESCHGTCWYFLGQTRSPELQFYPAIPGFLRLFWTISWCEGEIIYSL